MKRESVLLMSIIALSAAGCRKKEEPAKASALSSRLHQLLWLYPDLGWLIEQ